MGVKRRRWFRTLETAFYAFSSPLFMKRYDSRDDTEIKILFLWLDTWTIQSGIKKQIRNRMVPHLEPAIPQFGIIPFLSNTPAP